MYYGASKVARYNILINVLSMQGFQRTMAAHPSLSGTLPAKKLSVTDGGPGWT